MGREHKIIFALQGSAVPVATTVGLCVDDSVNDAPFYVMNHVAGPCCTITKPPPRSAEKIVLLWGRTIDVSAARIDRSRCR